MAIGIEVTNIKFFNELVNGKSFDLNLSNYATTLVGNVGDRVKFTAKIGLWYEKELESYSVVSGGGVTTIYMNGANFITDCGFSVGDSVQYGKPVDLGGGSYGVTTFSGTIAYLDENKVSITVTSGTPPSDGQEDGVSGYYAHVLVGTQKPLNAIYSFCINENDDPFNEFSIIDNTLQSFYKESISNLYENATWKDIYKGQYTGTMYIRTASDSTRNIRYLNYASVLNYEIQHVFTIPFWREEEESNLDDNIIIDDLNGDKSYKYAFKFDLRTSLKNNKTSKAFVFDSIKGNVGYFNESFNGFGVNYSVANVTLTDLGNSNAVDGLVVNSTTRVQLDLISDLGTFVSDQKIILGHSYLAPENEYSKTLTTFDTNLIYETVRVTTGVLPSSSTIFKNYSSTFYTTGLIKIQFEIEYPIEYQEKLSDETSFLLFVDVFDNANIEDSDKAKIIIKKANHLKDSDVTDLVFGQHLYLFPHDKNLDISLDGFTDYKGFIEDGFGINCKFWLSSLVQRIDRMQLKIISINANGDYFELFSRDLNKDTLVFNGSYWDGGYTKGLGYNLAENSKFNIESLTALDFASIPATGGARVFELKTALKIPYQNWISNNNVPNSFFNINEENNNQNYDSSNYDVSDYTLKLALEMDLITDEEVSTTYRILSNALVVNGFSESTDYTMEIKTLTESDVDTDGLLLKNQKTIIKGILTQLSGDFTDISGVWAVIRIEEKDSQSTNNYELSSIYPSFLNNPLIPLAGETNVKIELNLGKIEVSCMVDNDLLNKSVDYRISVRVGKTDEVIVLGAYNVGYSDGYN